MIRQSLIRSGCVALVVMAFLILSWGTAAIAAESGPQMRFSGNQLADQGSAAVETGGDAVVESSEDDPRAIVKEGMFDGIAKGYGKLIETKPHRRSSYRLEENYRVLSAINPEALEEVSLEFIPPHSFVKFILIEGQIREIILLQRSS